MPNLTDNIIKNYISRIVAFVLTPVLLPLAGAVANWIQDALGLNLTGLDLTLYVVTVITGVALAAFQWLRGRVKWEVAKVEYDKVVELGKQGRLDAGVTGTPSRGA